MKINEDGILDGAVVGNITTCAADTYFCRSPDTAFKQLTS